MSIFCGLWPGIYGWANAYFDRQLQKRRLLFASMEGCTPVGEILLIHTKLQTAGHQKTNHLGVLPF
jgi:hypothetical protein